MGTEPVRVSEEKKKGIEDYQEQSDAATMTDAADDVVELGLREVTGPISHVVRERAIDAAYHLSLVAVVILLSGWTTDLITTGTAIAVSVTILTVSAVPIAALETVTELKQLLGRGDE